MNKYKITWYKLCLDRVINKTYYAIDYDDLERQVAMEIMLNFKDIFDYEVGENES